MPNGPPKYALQVTSDSFQSDSYAQVTSDSYSKFANWSRKFSCVDLKIMYDGSTSVYVYAPVSMQDQVCGMCGRYNNLPTDDYTTPTGQVVTNYADFGNLWLDPTDTRQITPVQNQALSPCSGLSSNQVSLWNSFVDLT